jgi:hypothetical protein
MLSKYKVQGNVLPADKTQGEHMVQARTISQWVDADSPLDAACKFIMDNDQVNSSPVLVVDTEYNIGNYPLDLTKISIDYMVGLRQ